MELLQGKINQYKGPLLLRFRRADPDNSHKVDRESFVQVLSTLHMKVKEAQLERLFELADQSGAGSIDYDDEVRGRSRTCGAHD